LSTCATPTTGRLRWLSEVLGAREALRLTLPDGRVGHAELVIGNAVVSLGLAAQAPAPTQPVSRQSLRAMTSCSSKTSTRPSSGRCTRRQLVDEATDQPWGLRQAIVADPKATSGNSASTCAMSQSTAGARPNSAPAGVNVGPTLALKSERDRHWSQTGDDRWGRIT